MAFLTKIFKRKKKFDIPELIKNSDWIQNLCINELRHNEHIDMDYWHHALPLKSEKESFLKKDNWDLSEENIEKISKYLKELYDYANNINEIKDNFENVTDFLPPWFVFPLYDATTMWWRQGTGEYYMEQYIGYIRSLSDKDFEEYDEAYPSPEYMSINMFHLNVVNYELRK